MTPPEPTMDGGDERVVFVTGAARRIGAAIIRRFHQHGYRVVIHYRQSQAEALALQQQLNSQRADSARLLKADLDDITQVMQLGGKALQCFGRIDVLVNNASTFTAAAVGEISTQHWQQMLNSNAMAPLFLSQSLAPALRETRGCIINLTDINAERGMAGFTAYTMAKAALLAMTRSLARELAPEIRVNSVSPGAILWPEQAADPQQHAGQQAHILAGIPAGRLGSESEIADTVHFLATGGSYMTGANIRVDGGRALCPP